MLVRKDLTKNQLDSIEVGDNIKDEKGNSGIVAKIDISKYRKFVQYFFRLKGDGTIDILK